MVILFFVRPGTKVGDDPEKISQGEFGSQFPFPLTGSVHTNPVCGFAHLWQEPCQRGHAELFAGGQSSKFKPFSTSQLRPLPAGYTLRLAEQNQLGWCQPRLCRVGPRAAFEGLHSPCSEGVGRVPVFLTTHWGRRIFLPKICPCVTQL